MGKRIQVEPISAERLDQARCFASYDFTPHHLELIVKLYEELQLNSVEAGHPEQDLLLFALRTDYFAVITKIAESVSLEPSTPPSMPEPLREISSHTMAKEQYHLKEEDKNIDDLIDTIDNEWNAFQSNTTLTIPPNPNAISNPHRKRNRKRRNTRRMQNINPSVPQPSTSNVLQEVQERLVSRSQTPTNKERLLTQPEATHSTQPPIGIVYLIGTQQSPFPPSTIGEITVGIILDPEQRGYGYAKEALELILEEAFQAFKCHRVQANVLDTYSKARVVNLFTQMRFSHEGTRRRSYYSLLEQEWKDITSFAILDTDWMMRSYFKAAPKTLWEEMLFRHEREREALLRWEQIHLKKSSSTETLRHAQPMTPIGMTSQSESECEMSDVSDSEASSVVFVDKGKRRLDSENPFETSRPGSAGIFDDSDVESEYGSVFRYSSSPPPQVPASPAFSAFSGAESDTESNWSAQTGSDWDLLETGSSVSSSSLH